MPTARAWAAARATEQATDLQHNHRGLHHNHGELQHPNNNQLLKYMAAAWGGGFSAAKSTPSAFPVSFQAAKQPPAPSSAPFSAPSSAWGQPQAVPACGQPPQQQLKCAGCGPKAAAEFSPNQLRNFAARRCKHCVEGKGASAGWPAKTTAPVPAAWGQPQRPAVAATAAHSSAWGQPQAAPAWGQPQRPAAAAPTIVTAPTKTTFTWQQPQAAPAPGTAPATGFAFQQQPASTKLATAASGFAWNTAAQAQVQPPQQQQKSGFRFNTAPSQHPPKPAAAGSAFQFNTAVTAQATASPFKLGATPPTFQTSCFKAPSTAPTAAPSAAWMTAPTAAPCQPTIAKPTEPLPVHSGISCDICGIASIAGPRYKCMCCPNFDACDACISKDPLGANCARVAAGAGAGCKHDVLVRVCESSWMRIGSEALQNQSTWVHPGYGCSGCGVLTIVGRRFTCTVCDNVHFCERCDFCGVHAAAGLAPHPMLRFNPNAPTAFDTALATPASAAAAGASASIVPATCFCCGWPQGEADARGHKKKTGAGGFA